MPRKGTTTGITDSTRRRLQQPGQQPQQRGFARAVGANQLQRPPGDHLGRHAFKKQPAAALAGQIDDFQRFAHAGRLNRRSAPPQLAKPGKSGYGAAMAAPVRPHLSTTSNLAINFGPLLLFFAGSKAGKALFEHGDLPGLHDADLASAMVGTGIFVAASLIAAVWHWAKTRHLPPAMVFTTLIVVLFGGLTIWLQDKAFIQLKPTIIYGVFSALLFGGLVTGRPTLQLVMGEAMPGLTDRGWRLLTRNWALFFLGLLVANEAARRLLSYDDWLSFKVWGVTIAIFAFTLAQAPLLTKHGLKLD